VTNVGKPKMEKSLNTRSSAQFAKRSAIPYGRPWNLTAFRWKTQYSKRFDAFIIVRISWVELENRLFWWLRSSLRENQSGKDHRCQ